MMEDSNKVSPQDLWMAPPSAVPMLQATKHISAMLEYQCETLINDDALLQRLRDEKFDLAISEACFYCPFGLFEVLKIPATIPVVSNAIHEILSYAIGEPFFPSYVPGRLSPSLQKVTDFDICYFSLPALFSSNGEKMGFVERVQNLFALAVIHYMHGYASLRENSVFVKKFGHPFKDYYVSTMSNILQNCSWDACVAKLETTSCSELVPQSSFIFTNGNPYLDFPRPALHKTVMIGGFAVTHSEKKTNLSKEWDSILNARKHTVLVSFGSFTKSTAMPEEFKQGLLDTFAAMPDVTFIWKYEDTKSDIAKSLPNVHLVEWVPQVQLLKDSRLSLFLTHGGLASTNELAYMGKPAIVIPLLGDQMRNAQMIARHKGALVLDKSDLANPRKLKKTFEEILYNPNYAKNAERLSQMLRNQPISPTELLVKHVEFAARLSKLYERYQLRIFRFGRLPNLDPYGRHLSFIQYYLLDIITVVALAVFLILAATAVLIRRCCCIRQQKLKQN
ncbi:UDP-glucoronosyl and UDP-glucosyl transferase [Oesophagostomum dentatum]|uniref:UDP-glucuronosyltransferase n=1 Tax=Oesophagostomum dentatum TaxID=61180 RepID=A0A0B1TR90_OESDE|nr:UDP-glucoronosyl and UDP-glucosyl transferase [Oesophagostomum dentatum]